VGPSNRRERVAIQAPTFISTIFIGVTKGVPIYNDAY
jgi:hypothetical protein